MDWLKAHFGNIIKAGSLVIALGGGALTFFVNLKTDVAVLQTDTQQLKSSVAEVKSATSEMSRKIDRLYETFILNGPFAER